MKVELNRMRCMIGCALLAVSVSATRGDDAAPVVSKDGTIQLTPPDGWGTDPTGGRHAGKIYITNPDTLSYCLVISESKEDISHKDIEEYAQRIEQIVKDKGTLTNRVESKHEPLTINGQPAVRFQVSCNVKGAKVVYVKTFIESKGYWNQIMCWTGPSHVKASLPDFEKIADSFKEIEKP